MPACPSCASDYPEGSRFCPVCGALLGSTSTTPTRTSVRRAPPPAARPAPPAPALKTPSSPGGSDRFLPGTLLADRYRIFGLLGKGGMGEVYRADDLKLGQVVALKFLPESVEGDEKRLARFLNELKIARQISHPNVCRLYDVAEVDGHHFLSMEYVDGEDLASLLRRIGRLPGDKAVQIARQLCAGLAAAHEQGVLHRDLKPANVMIDGRGRARITDFGLAVLAEKAASAEVAAGTPAYMAPEQHDGKEVSVKSDLYSLGLVLYELFTGRPAYKATTGADLQRLIRESTPANPSSLVANLDPAVERVILRCLAKEPRDRPASALMVAAALPGGDPLAAALAAGETPSPELVAEAGAVGGLQPRAAVACLAALVIGVGLVILISGKTQLSRIVPLPKSPDVLAERAREVIRKLGQPSSSTDSAYQFRYSRTYVDYLRKNVPAPAIWERLAGGPIYAIQFWYRQSPRNLVPYEPSGVDYDDPPPLIPGMVRIILEPDGQLLRFEAVPPDQDDSKGPWPEPAWTQLFEEAGLDAAGFHRVEPEWSPPVYADRREAWEGPGFGAPDARMRIEAAGYHGKPISFQIISPWSVPAASGPSPIDPAGRVFPILIGAVLVAILLGGVLLARRNLRFGRSDRRGGSTLAIFMFSAIWVEWILQAHHIADPAEALLVLRSFAFPVLFSCVTWVFYLALEPYVRRLWPEVLVSWVRLIDGRFRDPLVGRDALLGLLVGLALTLLSRAWPLGSRWLGLPTPMFDKAPFWMEYENLSGLRFALGNLLELLAASLFFAVLYIVSLLLLRVALRRQWLAVAGFVVLWTTVEAFSSDMPRLALFFGSLQVGLWLVVFLRLGLLPLLIAGFVRALLVLFPMTLDISSWYVQNTILALIVLAGIAAYGIRVSLAGREIFRDDVLDS